MIKDITIGQYYPGHSLIHQSDPRVKIILTIVFTFMIFIIQNFIGLFLYALFTAVIILGSRVPLKKILKGLKPIVFILVITSLINVFTTKGEPIITFWVLKITWEGIAMSIMTIGRLVILVAGASLVTFTTTPIALTDGIEKLMNPFKRIGFPAHEMAMMISIALRFIPTLLDETDKIMKAQASRGADFDSGNLLNRAKSFIPVLIPLFLSAFRRADELAIAMESRGYKGSEGRTRLKELKLGKSDVIISLVMICSIGIIFIAQSYF